MSGFNNQTIKTIAKQTLMMTMMMTIKSTIIKLKSLNMLMWCCLALTTNKCTIFRKVKSRSQDETEFLFLSLLDSSRAKCFAHSRTWKMFYKSLDHVCKRLHDQRILCVALRVPYNSSCRHLIISSQNNQALLTLIVFDYSTFDWLLKKRDATINTVPSVMMDAFTKFMELSDCLGMN